MGVSGLYAYLNNRAPGAAQSCTVRRAEAGSGAGAGTGVAAQEEPQRIVIIDANGLYHHLLFKYCSAAPRSLGGEWARFASATRRFIRAFHSCSCALIAVFDGANSRAEGKSSTRNQRARDRRGKMRRWDAEMRARMEAGAGHPAHPPLPPGCVPLLPRDESTLPVPAGTLQAFLQVLQEMGVACWNSDGENDEHIAALAVRIASAGLPPHAAHPPAAGVSDAIVAAESTAAFPAAAARSPDLSRPRRRVPVDILGQDSDFLVFDTRIVAPRSSSGSGGEEDDEGTDEAVGYVPLDSLRFHEADPDEDEEDDLDADATMGEDDDAVADSESGAPRISSISFKRYSTSTLCQSLRLPPCLLPSLACLVGNDSALDMLHFHTFTHSAAFGRLVREGHAQGRLPGALGKSGSKNTNAASVENNGGYNTGTQLVEAVLAYLHTVTRGCDSRRALDQCSKLGSGGGVGGMMSPAQQSAHQLAMQEVVQRIFGEDASVLPRRAAMPQSSECGEEDNSALDPDADAGASPPAAHSSTHPSTPLQQFRAAQLKYSLARFFRPQLLPVASVAAATAPSGWGVLDAGFHAVLEQQQREQGQARGSAKTASEDDMDEDDPTSHNASPIPALSTAVLLPLPLLRLYRVGLFSPVLLSILLTRHFVAHLALGDIAHPCALHTQPFFSGAGAGAGGQAQSSAPGCAHARWERDSDECWCVSAQECTAGVRKRVYEMMMCEAGVRPRAMPRADDAAVSAGSSTVGAVSSLFSSLARGVTSLFGASDNAAASAFGPSSAPPAPLSPSALSDVCIWELIPVAHGSNGATAEGDGEGDDPARWVQVVARALEVEGMRTAVSNAAASWSSTGGSEAQLPALFPELHASANVAIAAPLDAASRRDVAEEWARLFALLDVVPDLRAANSAKLPSLPSRIDSLRSAMLPLVQAHPSMSLGPLALVFRATFLHSVRGLLVRRFEPPAIGDELDPPVRAQLHRAAVGVNAMLVQASLLLAAAGAGGGAKGRSHSAAPVLSVEALSLAHLFMESYHWTEYALQSVRVHAHLRRFATEAAEAAAGEVAAELELEHAQANPSPLVPLHEAYSGTLFHSLYAQLLSVLHPAGAEAGGSSATGSKNKKKRRKHAIASPPAAVTAPTPPAAATAGIPSSRRPTAAAAPAASALFSPALSHALADLDDLLHDRALELLVERSPSSTATAAAGSDTATALGAAPALSLFLSLKRFVFSSVGLAVPLSWVTPGAPAAEGAPVASPHLSRAASLGSNTPAHLALWPRPVLPYETVRHVGVVERDRAGSAPSSAAPFFSLCCAPGAASVLALPPDQLPLAACLCGVHAIHLPVPAAGDGEEAGSDAEDAKAGWTPAGKSKRKKKSKGRGKR